MGNNNLKIAIIGANASGLACALECEKLGIIPDVFELQDSVGWMWPAVSVQLEVFANKWRSDIVSYLREFYGISFQSSGDLKDITLKAPKQVAKIKGKLGFLFARGKNLESMENELARQLLKTPIHFNSSADYKELSKKYDYVVVATGNEIAAKELNVWKDLGNMYCIGGIAIGAFTPGTSQIFFNTDYAGTGYARLTPFDPTKAIVALYITNYKGDFCGEKLFQKFLDTEGLSDLNFVYKMIPPVFTLGRVKKFQVGNILLAGRAAGLTERLVGEGAISALISGVMAARSIIKGKDYETMVKPLQDHIENISAFRTTLNKYNNDDFDKLIGSLNVPGVKQLIYNSGIDLVDLSGWILKKFGK